MTHGDDKGLVLPPKVAPIQVVIIPIYKNDEGERKVMEKVETIREHLEENDIRVHVDSRSGLSPGYKFNDWELKGVPVRIEIGPKDIEKESIVVAKRIDREKSSLKFNEIGEITNVLELIQETMLANAIKKARENTMTITNYQEFKSHIEKGGFLHSPWCGKLECEEKIKEETGADIRVIPFDSQKTDEKCIYCEQQSECIPVFARGY